MTYSGENVLVAVNEFTGSLTRQEDFPTKQNKYVRTDFPKNVTVHPERVGNEVKDFCIVGSLEIFCEQTMEEMEKSGGERCVRAEALPGQHEEKCGRILLTMNAPRR